MKSFALALCVLSTTLMAADKKELLGSCTPKEPHAPCFEYYKDPTGKTPADEGKKACESRKGKFSKQACNRKHVLAACRIGTYAMMFPMVHGQPVKTQHETFAKVCQSMGAQLNNPTEYTPIAK